MSAAFSLEQIRIASPCPVKWSDMKGDDTKRFCRHCSLHVYNLSNMTRADAEALVLGAEGRLCAQLWRRADGTVITKDCPVGVGEARRRRTRVAMAVGALVSVTAGAFGSWALGESRWNSTRTRLIALEPFRTVRSWVIAPPPSSPGVQLGGSVCLPITPTNNSSGIQAANTTSTAKTTVHKKSRP